MPTVISGGGGGFSGGTVAGATTFSSDVLLDRTGSSEATPREIRFVETTGGARLSLISDNGGGNQRQSGWQTASSRRDQIFTFSGLEIRGTRRVGTVPGYVSGTATDPGVSIINAQAGGIGLVVQGAASQSANLQAWQNSAGVNQAKIGPTGDFDNAGNTDLSYGLGGRIRISGVGIGLYGVSPVARAAAITSPTGGATVDAEARTAIDAIRVALTNIGITA